MGCGDESMPEIEAERGEGMNEAFYLWGPIEVGGKRGLESILFSGLFRKNRDGKPEGPT